MIVFGDARDGRAICEMARASFDVQRDVVIANVFEGKLLGGFVLSGFTPASAYVHAAGFRPHWCNRDLLWVVADYPFNQLSLERLFCTASEANVQSIRFILRVGFKEVARIPGRRQQGVGDIVFAIDYEGAQRWLSIKPRTLTLTTGVS